MTETRIEILTGAADAIPEGANVVIEDQGTGKRWSGVVAPTPKQREEREERRLLALIQEHIGHARRLADESDDPEEMAYHEGRANGYGEAASLIRTHSPEEPVGKWSDSVHMLRLGRATDKVEQAQRRGEIGDSIDRGLFLVHELKKEGYHVHPIGQPLDGEDSDD